MKNIAILPCALICILLSFFTSSKVFSQTTKQTFTNSGTFSVPAVVTQAIVQACGGFSDTILTVYQRNTTTVTVGAVGIIGNGLNTYVWLLGSNSNHSSGTSANYFYSQKNGYNSAYPNISKQTLNSKNIKITTCFTIQNLQTIST